MNDTVNEEGRLPVPLKVFGVLSIVGGLASLGDLAPVIFSFVQGVGGGTYRTASIVIFAGLMAVLTSSAVLFVFLGVRLLRNRRAHAAQAANTPAALTVLAVIGTLMLFGLSAHHIGYLGQIVILVAVTSYLDPQLHEERRLQRKLKKMDKEQRSEERRLARERKPKIGFITLNFVIGGAFEYFTSWIMEFSFGIRAWDYSGTFLSIDGRTNFVFMVMWGVLGVAWIKLLLPRLLKLINLIPWNWRYAVTAVCAGLMLVDGVMTVQSIDCWYARSAGKAPDTPIEEFYAKHFDNAYMEHRFQTMTMDVNDAARADR